MSAPLHRTAAGPAPTAVAEMPGFYGPFTFTEKLLQRIWSRGEFDSGAAHTSDGRAVEVVEPGRWNRLGGPDFLGARLRLGGAMVAGDIELHLHAADWVAHAHAADPAYAGVVLHVVLFPSAEKFTAGAGGRPIPVLALLPLLQRGLEEYAEDEAMEALAHRPLAVVPAALAALDAAELTNLLADHAERRWRRKIHFARLRLDRLGWEDACHHAALEILGHRFNRAPMLAVAAQFPLAQWTAGDAGAVAERAMAAGRWHRHAVRPANHPAARLRQYAAWSAARPDWPARLKAVAGALPVLRIGPGSATPATGVGEARRAHRLPSLRKHLAETICAGAVGGTRFDTLVCDGFLPLLAAETGAELGGLWQCWFPGDLPEAMLPALRALGIFAAPSRPASHGAVQGLLGWRLEASDAEGGRRRAE
jgi:hypothetical protein